MEVHMMITECTIKYLHQIQMQTIFRTRMRVYALNQKFFPVQGKYYFVNIQSKRNVFSNIE